MDMKEQPIRGNFAISVSMYERFRERLIKHGATWQEATDECLEIAVETFQEDVRSTVLLVYREFEKGFVRHGEG